MDIPLPQHCRNEIMDSPIMRNSRRRRKARISSIMDNPTIYYVGSDSVEWANYLETKLAEEEYQIPVTLCDVTNIAGELKKSTTNILLVSPDLADLDSWNAFRNFNPKQSIAVLLNISEEEFTVLCSHHKQFPEILQWRIQKMEPTDDSVRHLLLSIIRIYERLGFEDAFDEYSGSPSPCGKRSAVIPSNEPVHFEIDSEGEENIYETPPPPREKNDVYKIIQDNDDKQRVYLLMDREADTNIDIIREGCPDGTTTADLIKKSLYEFNLPDKGYSLADGSFKFRVFSGSQGLGRGEVKCGSKLELLREILSEELNPITLLCQAMGTRRGDLESLDTAMEQTMKQWRPLRFLQQFEGPLSSLEGQTKFPTILHFGAQFHLEKFCRELLHFPGMVAACVTNNSDGHYPSDIARREGLESLAKELETFVREYAALQENSQQIKHDSGFGDVVPPPTRCQRRSSNDSDYVPMDGKENPPLPPRITIEETESDEIYMTMSDIQGNSDSQMFKDRNSAASDSQPNSPRNSGHQHTNNENKNRESNHNVDREPGKLTSPSSSRPCSAHFSISPISSRTPSPSTTQHVLSTTLPSRVNPDAQEVCEMQLSQTKHHSNSSSTEEEPIKFQDKQKPIRRTSSAGLSGKIGNFLHKITRPRKQSVPDLGGSLANFYASKTKFYTKQSVEGNSPSDNSLKQSRSNSQGSERDSGSYDGDDTLGSRPPSSELSQSSPMTIPVRIPLRPPSVKRQKSVRLNHALQDFNVLAPPLPERRPLKRDNS